MAMPATLKHTRLWGVCKEGVSGSGSEQSFIRGRDTNTSPIDSPKSKSAINTKSTLHPCRSTVVDQKFNITTLNYEARNGMSVDIQPLPGYRDNIMLYSFCGQAGQKQRLPSE